MTNISSIIDCLWILMISGICGHYIFHFGNKKFKITGNLKDGGTEDFSLDYEILLVWMMDFQNLNLERIKELEKKVKELSK